jgi:transcriptional regulator with XRE-family HTH domain
MSQHCHKIISQKKIVPTLSQKFSLNKSCSKLAKYLSAKKSRKSNNMKREPYYRNLLGGTQEEMAMLLNISRSHWAKIELGTRMPSTKIQLALAEMAKHAENNKAAKSPSAPDAPQLNQHQELLGRMLRENEYQQAVTARKIAAVAKKQDAQLKLADAPII